MPPITTGSPLEFHDTLQLLKAAWSANRLFSLPDALGPRLALLFNMIDKLKHPTVNFFTIDTAGL